MKKIIITLLLMLISLPVFAITVELKTAGKNEKIIGEIGYRLLNANRIPYKITFFVLNNAKEPNAKTYYRDGSIAIYDSVIKYTEDENEIAGIIAHEISHAVDYRQGIFKGLFSYTNWFNSKNYEYKADKRAVDYMVKANYNPLALIVALNRIGTEYRYDIFSTHPLTSRRMATIYEYIYTKYPEYLVQNKYISHPLYQNFLITSEENRKKLEEKIKSKSNKKVKYL